jgi:1-deoxy-D-xylulose-5-phosphate reductoisomerase
MKKKIVILGSTGSIGKSLINILKKDKKNIEIELLTINRNYKEVIKQIKIFNVKNVIAVDKKAFIYLSKYFKDKKIEIYQDFSSINKILENKKIDYTMSAISGFEGLAPTIKIIKYSKKIAIANKESIICGWSLIKKKIKRYKAEFIPIDSEHFSIWSLMNYTISDNIEKVFITASGGPFNKYPLNKFKLIKPITALKHPNWSMGKKISIDSATMMNKVFEIIEAKKIFNFEYNQLRILIHPQSYLHAIVKFNNGLTKILVHDTNMMIPIFNSLYPMSEKKIKSNNLDIDILNNLNLTNIDNKRFPVVKILNMLPSKDSLFETLLVSANDTLVNLFLNNKIQYTDISKFLLKIVRMREFNKYKRIQPKNINDINKLAHYVSLKITSMSI